MDDKPEMGGMTTDPFSTGLIGDSQRDFFRHRHWGMDLPFYSDLGG